MTRQLRQRPPQTRHRPVQRIIIWNISSTKLSDVKWNLEKHYIKYVGTNTKPIIILTNRSQACRYALLLSTGPLRRLNRQPNLHDEDVFFSSNEGPGEYIHFKKNICSFTNRERPNKTSKIQNRGKVYLISVMLEWWCSATKSGL